MEITGSKPVKTSLSIRGVERLVRGRETTDGAGVRLTRVLTHDLQRRLDPFLMLDAFRNEHADDYIGGFPNHPHRGFETVTYMIEGRMRHNDSAGNSGMLMPGGAQWMVAGSGLIHSELPEQQEGLMEGFQLWVNLPAGKKMQTPAYRDFAPADIPEYRKEGLLVRVIAGKTNGVDGAVLRPDTDPLFFDIHLESGQGFTQTLPAGHNAFVFVYRGEMNIGGTPVADRNMAILANDGAGTVQLEALHGASRAILVAGRPLNEPIAQYGPFVMNTEQEIREAIDDYSHGLFGNGPVRKD